MKAIITFILGGVFCCMQASAQQVKFGVEAGGNWSHYKNDKSKKWEAWEAVSNWAEPWTMSSSTIGC